MYRYYKNSLPIINLIVLPLILINNTYCYYVLPLKTSYDYDTKDLHDKTKIMHNFLTNNIFTELSIANPPQKLATLIKSRDYCTYIGSYLCNIEDSNYDSTSSKSFNNTTEYNLKFKGFNNVCLATEKMNLYTQLNDTDPEEVDLSLFYHAPNNSFSSDNPYTCGVFGFRHQLDESQEGENKCISLIEGLYNNNSTPEKINNLVFSIDYSQADEVIDGKLIIGNYPHEYNSDKYDVNNYVQIFMNETSLEENKDFHTTFYEAYFYKNNNESFNNKISIDKPEQLHSIFILEQNMFCVPESFFNLYIDNFFQEYINNRVCQYVEIDLGRYKTIICDKNKTSSTDSFDITFPSVFFNHFGFNTTFEFTKKELLVEKDELLYFMMYVDTQNIDGYWGIGKIFMEKYLLTFDFENHAIGFYNGTKENKDEEEEKKEFDFIENGIYVIIILAVNILVAISCAIYAIIHKCIKSKIDPTIMIDSLSAENNENLNDKDEEKVDL